MVSDWSMGCSTESRDDVRCDHDEISGWCFDILRGVIVCAYGICGTAVEGYASMLPHAMHGTIG